MRVRPGRAYIELSAAAHHFLWGTPMGLYSRGRRSEAAAQWQRRSEALQVHSLVAGFFPNWDASAVGLRILRPFLRSRNGHHVNFRHYSPPTCVWSPEYLPDSLATACCTPMYSARVCLSQAFSQIQLWFLTLRIQVLEPFTFSR